MENTTTKPRRIQRKRTKGWRKPENTTPRPTPGTYLVRLTAPRDSAGLPGDLKWMHHATWQWTGTQWLTESGEVADTANFEGWVEKIEA